MATMSILTYAEVQDFLLWEGLQTARLLAHTVALTLTIILTQTLVLPLTGNWNT